MTDWFKQQQDKIREDQRKAQENLQNGRNGTRSTFTDIYSAEYKKGQLERERMTKPPFWKKSK
jgi:hypothetical protein